MFYYLVSNVNIVYNGDAETGTCATGSGQVDPTGWYFTGTITQLAYDNNYINNRVNTIPATA